MKPGMDLCNRPFEPFDRRDIEQSIADRFHQIVDRDPGHLAVQSYEGMLTYGELDRRANQIARAILESDDPDGEPVGLLFGHDGSMAAAILGVLKTGRPYVPLDPRYPRARFE